MGASTKRACKECMPTEPTDPGKRNRGLIGEIQRRPCSGTLEKLFKGNQDQPLAWTNKQEAVQNVGFRQSEFDTGFHNDLFISMMKFQSKFRMACFNIRTASLIRPLWTFQLKGAIGASQVDILRSVLTDFLVVKVTFHLYGLARVVLI